MRRIVAGDARRAQRQCVRGEQTRIRLCRRARERSRDRECRHRQHDAPDDTGPPPGEAPAGTSPLRRHDVLRHRPCRCRPARQMMGRAQQVGNTRRVEAAACRHVRWPGTRPWGWSSMPPPISSRSGRGRRAGHAPWAFSNRIRRISCRNRVRVVGHVLGAIKPDRSRAAAPDRPFAPGTRSR